MFQFFSVASDGATTERQIYNRVFGQFRTSLRKDSVATYASIWTLFSKSVTGPDVICNALKFRRSVCRRRHKIRKIAVEILQSVKNPTQSLLQISYYAWLLLTQ